MAEFTLTIETHPDAQDRQVVIDGLIAFNRAVIGDPGLIPVGVFVRDAKDDVVGGALGVIKWRWLYLEKLWLPNELRGSGLGTRVMTSVEHFARTHDCLGVHLDTFEFQALPFYKKLGYDVFGVHDGFPPGYKQYHLRKTFGA